MDIKYDQPIEEDYQKVNVKRTEYDNGDLRFADYFAAPPMFFTQNLANVPLEGLYRDGHAFLIASGPSFAQVDRSLLDQPGILTMGLNNSPASFRPNLWTCVDSPSNFLASIWLDPKIQKIVPISHIHKNLFDSESWRDTKTKVGDCPNVVYYRRNEVVNTDQYMYEDTINWGNHSNVGGGRSVFMAAVRILFLLGIRRLYLLGVDLHMDEKNKYHFPQDRNRGSISGNMNTYNSMKEWFGNLKEHFDAVGFEVFNCNPDSALKVFPFISVEDAVESATSMLPKNEKTEGMYTRKAEQQKKAEEAKAKKAAAKYTDEDRRKSKEKLDRLRTELDDAKEAQNIVLQKLFPDFPQDAYLWAHKLKKPSDQDMAQLYEDLKLWIGNKTPPQDEKHMELYQSQIDINDARTRFRSYEKEKNKIHGVVR